MALTESQIQSQIIDYLRAKGIRADRQNVGASQYTDKNNVTRFVKFGDKGMSDILGCIPPEGKFLACEVKSEKQYNYVMKNYDRIKRGQIKTKRDMHLSNQIQYIEDIKRIGGVGLFACCIENVEDELKRIKNAND